jgi:putative ABC transport system substrate-binding protein
MNRREMIALLGGAAMLPAAAKAQTMPVVGWLSSRAPGESTDLVEAFRRGLSEAGFVEGKNLAIAFRWAEGHYDRLPTLAADLVGLRVGAIVAAGGPVPALRAQEATPTIPIVFTGLTDPISLGLVVSLNRPGRNVTGTSTFSSALTPKRLGLLHDLLPSATVIAVLVNPTNPSTESDAKQALAAAQTLGLRLHILNASTDREFDNVFATLVQQRDGALIVGTDPFFDTQRERLVSLSARHAIPTIYSFREYVEAGGMISYGNSISDNYRQAGNYTGRILKGEKPADLPVIEPTKFELVINLKTAKTLGLTIPPSVLAIADEVIE